MRNKILEFIYKFLFYLDSKLGNVTNYRGESAPYCGHSYSGHNGRITGSAYQGGDGEKGAKIGLWVVCEHTEGEDL